jgi:arginyl-tRNA synthetase
LIVDIFGADHIATFPDVVAGVNALGLDANHFKLIIHQFVTLKENQEQVKMSKRTGKSYTLDDLLDEVGEDVVRFFLLMRNVNTHLEFDLSLARENSEKNPVFYLQYAHARICSLFQKAKEFFKENNVEMKLDFPNLSLLKESDDINLIKKLSYFPNTIQIASQKSEPQILCEYLRDLAASFHQFYHNCRIISDDFELMKARLVVANAARTVLSNGLKILGISRPEKM